VSPVDRYRVPAGKPTLLADRDPTDQALLPGGDRDAGRAEVARVNERLAELQVRLAAEKKHRLLVVFQAMDTGGKDGAIRNVFRDVNPAGVHVTSFKQPSEDDLAHDYLRRIHSQVPGDGEIAIFNRSHYEDVLVVRVHELVPKARWRRRYGHINDFERLLADEGTTVVKFFLHISRDEQRKRLQARVDDPHKRWKFREGDLGERARWDEYMAAYEDALSQTSTERAPWWVVPANRKWYRDLVVSTVLVQTLESLDLQWPEHPELDGVTVA
jgi:PPK2 family polyphosphate:nucleotide phosphotransferase